MKITISALKNGQNEIPGTSWVYIYFNDIEHKVSFGLFLPPYQTRLGVAGHWRRVTSNVECNSVVAFST